MQEAQTIPATLPDAGSVSTEQPYRLFKEYPDRSELLAAVHEAFLDGIERFAGRECREACERDGLEHMHLHYPYQRVDLLQGFVDRRMRRRTLEWSARVGREALGIESDFFVQDLLVVRVHYPLNDRGTHASDPSKPPLLDRAGFGLASTVESLRDLASSRNAVRHPLRMLAYMRQRMKRGSALPSAYRCHAAHLDTWLGQPIRSLSVWLGIAGVNRDNSMCLYPETIGTPLPVSSSRFLGVGYTLPKPTRPDIEDGDLFVFSTDMLHGSQANISGKTRVALTTRIDAGTPEFDDDNLWYVQRWYSADGLLRSDFRYKRVESEERSSERRAEGEVPESTPAIRVAHPFEPGREYEVGPSEAVPEGAKVAVEFDNREILVLRLSDGLAALNGQCPHGGYRLADGFHDDRTVSCPGHGLEFDLRTGRTKVDCFKVSPLEVTERGGTIFVKG